MGKYCNTSQSKLLRVCPRCLQDHHIETVCSDQQIQIGMMFFVRSIYPFLSQTSYSEEVHFESAFKQSIICSNTTKSNGKVRLDNNPLKLQVKMLSVDCSEQQHTVGIQLFNFSPCGVCLRGVWHNNTCTCSCSLLFFLMTFLCCFTHATRHSFWAEFFLMST